MRAELHRKYTEQATYGELTIGELTVFTIELPWLSNKNSISCIPEGLYKVKKIISPSQGLCFSIMDVTDRSHILIHVANYVSELRGCIAPGVDQRDINNDGIIDNVSSRDALVRLLEYEISSILIKS